VPHCPVDHEPEQGVSHFLCRTHWRLVSPTTRAGIRRSYKRLAELAPGTVEWDWLASMHQRFWARAKKQAIERAAGI
jgi:hypothetical protein